MSEGYDLLVIGGGVNGAGIARDAAGRGMRVLLAEKDDLAAHTSSASTKLVHGGLRYLENYEFRLVRESLQERERLLAMAPHIIWPLRFVLPYDKGLRPKWMLRAGLFLYDHIGGRKALPGTETVDLTRPPHSQVLEPRLTSGFAYSDCWVEDARLVVLNTVDAAEHGADIRVRTEVTGLERRDEDWLATLRGPDGAEEQVSARQVVNAAGPWVDAVLGKAIPGEDHRNLRLVQGSHLIFPRLFAGDHCYIFQNGDGRIVFAIPYEREFTLVGTTDRRYEGDPGEVAITDGEADYICAAINEYLATDVTPEDAIWSYSGVRPLYDDKSGSDSTVTRDYVFELDRGAQDAGPPILSIFGGKITTYRKLAEHALERLGAPGKAWTADEALPGGDLPVSFEAFAGQMIRTTPFLPQQVVWRLCRAYGSRVRDVIGTATDASQLGEHFGQGLYEAEIRHLVQNEFARSADDVLWRRSKLGLHMSDAQRARVADWFEAQS
ncbi:glycerol-3-phosphate dehydrogenase [Paraurantiacibacter namhicola]|uniref:Glycerol-3-phosphate dehydrogenase n=1 Tax=Paraurantiacibacter namhicola TaxID=645517 RepID=A0A1C7DAE2_9SPHN|nr:glycerol-3-phosphate dehydrogenase [Paraurantiacibacter namhicola]ANU08469.1 Aerobic glycerol-3-phosphate dehydrogenase [Paraurantiacibacter namhicola]